MGAAEPCENMDWQSGPRLEIELSCCDTGRSESLRIHEPFEDEELRRSSVTGVAFTSPGFPCIDRRFEDLGDVTCCAGGE